MIPIFLDMETYYDKEYSLKKMSTQSYIWDNRFKVHGVGLAAGRGAPVWVSGPKIKTWLEKTVPGNVVVCHNANFDAAILAWRYGLRPKLIVDTVSLSRAIIGERLRSHALGSIAEYLLKEAKGGFLAATMGVRDLSLDAERQLAEYCLKDTDLCRQIFYTLIPHLPKQELLIMDMCSRMYTEPKLWLDNELLQNYHSRVVAARMRTLDDAGVEDAKEVRSNPKFAELLRSMGVEPPMKQSPTTGEQTYAFAKTDEGMMALEDHPDERVQALVAARLQNRSTLAETRCESFMTASRYGEFPIPYLFSGAMTTHRWAGCLVAETKILVYDWRSGVTTKCIVDVLPDDLVWDGQEFVKHDGVKFSGYKPVIEYCGLTGTAEHRVFLADGGQSTLAEAKAKRLNLAVSSSPAKNQVEYAKIRSLG